MMVLPANDAERATIALDLGAGDIIYDPFDPAEMAVRPKNAIAPQTPSRPFARGPLCRDADGHHGPADRIVQSALRHVSA